MQYSIPCLPCNTQLEWLLNCKQVWHGWRAVHEQLQAYAHAACTFLSGPQLDAYSAHAATDHKNLICPKVSSTILRSQTFLLAGLAGDTLHMQGP